MPPSFFADSLTRPKSTRPDPGWSSLIGLLAAPVERLAICWDCCTGAAPSSIASWCPPGRAES